MHAAESPGIARGRSRSVPPPPVAAERGVVRTAVTYGTFDLFHVGHVRLFERMRLHCDRLVVGVSTDEFNAIKGKRALIPFEQRIEIVRACRYVDEAFAERSWEQKPHDIRRYAATLFVMGDDWRGHFDHLSPLCDVLYLPRTPDVSSTAIRQRIGAASRR